MTAPVLQFHHAGILTASIEATRAAYERDWGAVVEAGPLAITAQGVRVCLLRLGDGTRLELVEAAAGSSLARMRSEGTGLYHLGFATPDLGTTVAGLEAAGYRTLPPFASELFGGRLCQFVLGPEGTLMELVEAP